MQPLGLAEDGTLVTEVALEKIAPQFKPAVDRVLAELVDAFADDLEAVYLYGSVVAGTAIEGKSDLDLILVFREQPDDLVHERVSSLARSLTAAHEHLFRDVGPGVTWTADLRSEKERYGGMCFLKHLCVRAHGSDLTGDVEAYRPTKEVAKGFNGDIRQSLASARSKLASAASDGAVDKLARSVAKKLVRTGFSLIMPRARCWTTDLQTSCALFAAYYPDRAKDMATALEWAKAGCSDRQMVVALLDTFGAWLADEFDREIMSS